MKRLVDSGALVTSFPCRPSTMPYGGVYYHSWYRGRRPHRRAVSAKSTHDIDYITHPGQASRLGGRPHLQNVFQRQQPAGLHCPDCPEYRTCPEKQLCCGTPPQGKSPLASCAACQGHRKRRCGRGAVHLRRRHAHFIPSDISCKNDAGRRGAFIGTRASAEFDFYTAQLRVDYYDERHTAVHQFHYPEGLVHFGGDEALARGFAEMLEGAPSPLGLEHGLASAAACLAARRAQTHRGKPSNTASERRFFRSGSREQSRRSAPAPYKTGYGDAAFSPQRPVCSAGRHTHQTGKRPMLFSIGRLLLTQPRAAGGFIAFCIRTSGKRRFHSAQCRKAGSGQFHFSSQIPRWQRLRRW